MPIELGSASNEMLVTHALQGSQRLSDGADFLAETARMQHLRTSNLSDAMAAQTLRIDPLATQVLQTRAASDQPQTSGAKTP